MMALRDLINSTSFVSATCVLLTFLISHHLLATALSPLRRVPGPFFARFTRLWYLENVWNGEFEKINIALHKKHGPIVRIAPNEYSIDDPEAVKIIYGHGIGFPKGPWYDASSSPESHLKDLFSDRDPKSHAANRRKVAALYSMTNLTSMEPQVHECASMLVEQFSKIAKSDVSQIVDLEDWLQRFAVDTIGLITLNKRFGFVERRQDPWGLLSRLQTSLVYISHIGIYPELHKFLFYSVQKLRKLFGRKRRRGFMNEQVAQRVSQHNNEKQEPGQDFLSKTLKIHDESPHQFPLEAVIGTCMTNIGAGADTTSSSLAGTLYHLMKVPEAMSKLEEELDKASVSGKLSSPPTFTETQNLPYLQACIKEGLRMHPATGLPLSRVVPEQGATIAGQFLPGGTIVGVNAWVAHANTSVFGSDAASFRPERWLESPERTAKMGRYFMAFGSGSRTCIGKNIALLEISLVLPELIRKFNFTLAEPEEELRILNRFVVKQLNLYCRVTLR